MGIFKRREKRAEEISFEDALLQSILAKTEMNKEKAMQIPTVAGAISLIGGIVASTPIKLYKETVNNGIKEVEEVDDYRYSLLNEGTGDTLSANEMWRAVVRDYFLGKGAYIYINKEHGKIKSLHYVDETYITVQEVVEPIFKDYDINVMGKPYKPFDFIKILRNTTNGASGKSIIQENDLILSVAYNSLKFEDALVRKGGNKKGYLTSEKKLSEEVMTYIKEAFRKQYSNNAENVIVLNEGMQFKESSNNAIEMQLNENKNSNAAELGKIFHMSPNLLNGASASIKPTEEIQKFVKLAVLPLFKTIEAAVNEDLLLEKEKESYYFAFDTKELLKGTPEERFKTYKAAIESKVMMIDEARYLEDLKPLGLDFINLGLNDVLYNPKTKEVYTPNTNKTVKMDDLKGGEENEDRNTE